MKELSITIPKNAYSEISYLYIFRSESNPVSYEVSANGFCLWMKVNRKYYVKWIFSKMDTAKNKSRNCFLFVLWINISLVPSKCSSSCVAILLLWDGTPVILMQIKCRQRLQGSRSIAVFKYVPSTITRIEKYVLLQASSTPVWLSLWSLPKLYL